MDPVNVALSAPAIVAIVELAKGFGVVGKWALLTAVVVAVGLFEAAHFLGGEPAFEAGMQGLLVGLAAAGLYDTAKTASKTAG